MVTIPTELLRNIFRHFPRQINRRRKRKIVGHNNLKPACSTFDTLCTRSPPGKARSLKALGQTRYRSHQELLRHSQRRFGLYAGGVEGPKCRQADALLPREPSTPMFLSMEAYSEAEAEASLNAEERLAARYED
ncbi:hypothetical protein OCU04_009908 [Sclerotinia nivalis]|uniref:Uncharacterized protein n=1 Tax=Sclerotinia nivalis TaxID=352851 RepID=A0A9X0ADI7_9HELO|nr:hypothetical protein OCU04_009908 [Sclerotinia nivalis]